MTTYTDDGYVDLDETEVRDRTGKRITEADALVRSEAMLARSKGGRPSLGGEAKPSPVIAVRVSGDVRDRLKARADREGKTLSELAREALTSYV